MHKGLGLSSSIASIRLQRMPAISAFGSEVQDHPWLHRKLEVNFAYLMHCLKTEWAGEMVQPVKSLPHKHEGLSMSSQRAHLKVFKSSTREAEAGGSL